MKLNELVSFVINKNNFNKPEDYATFCSKYLEFIHENLQAVIVSKNENHYRFFQYKEDGNYNVTRPINSRLFISTDEFSDASDMFVSSFDNLKEINIEERENINKFVYTCQQSIGATLDALPSGKSNTARKINGDLFEKYIRLLIKKAGVDVDTGFFKVPVKVGDETLLTMTYQHDVIVKKDGEVKAIGSVKTSSKDRLDKIFIDKLFYNKLTDTNTPHFAVFLNDVQRKGDIRNYGINTTFLTGHFKGYTVKLSPLDGVYYCDLRPNMISDNFLNKHIKSFDNLLTTDIWNFTD